MATQLKRIEPTQDDIFATGTALSALGASGQAIIFVDQAALDDLLNQHRARAANISGDASTKQGRQEMQTFETDMRKEKARIDRDRKAVTKDLRDIVSKVNDQGKEIEETLDALIETTCAPLFAWKEAEKARVAECEAVIAHLREAAHVSIDDTLEMVMARGAEVKDTAIDGERFGALAEAALEAKEFAFSQLRAAYLRLKKEAEDRAEAERVAAELAELKAAEAERQRVEQEKAAAVEIERKAAEAARIEEERKAAAAQAEKDRIAEAEKAAEERARQRAEEAAQAERDRIQHEHEAALQAERDRAAEAERLAQAERDRIAEVERQREAREAAERAEAERVAEQQRQDDANRELQRRLKTEAKEALMGCGASEELAQKIVVAIRAKDIPHMRWLKPGARIVEA